MSESESPRRWVLDPDALFCALVLSPASFPRNRFFALFEEPRFAAVRKRARRVRGIVDQLLEQHRGKAEIVGEQIMADGQVLLSYRVADLAFEHTTALSALEAATLRYALHQANAGPLAEDERNLVESRLRELGEAAAFLPEKLRPELG